jgi:hypothetical protein
MVVCLDETVDDSNMLEIFVYVGRQCCPPVINDPAGDQCAMLVLLHCSPTHASAIPIKLGHKTTSISFNRHSALLSPRHVSRSWVYTLGRVYKPTSSATITSPSLSYHPFDFRAPIQSLTLTFSKDSWSYSSYLSLTYSPSFLTTYRLCQRWLPIS